MLKHAKAASEDPYWVSPAYANTQPKVYLKFSKLKNFYIILYYILCFLIKDNISIDNGGEKEK